MNDQKEIEIQAIIDMNYRLLLLLGYATSIVKSYKRLTEYPDDLEKCNWFFKAVKAVVYENKPLPEMI